MSTHPVDEPFSLNISTDAVPNVSLEHDSTTNEVHIKFFNVDNELVLDLGGLLNDVGPLLSGLSTIAKYRALRTGLYKAVAKEDLVGAVGIIKALKDLQRTPEFDRVFENVDVTKKDPGRPLLSESNTAVLTGKEAEVLLAMLDEMFNGK